MSEPTARAIKDANARFGLCWGRELHHIRVGEGRAHNTFVEPIGTASHLHGPHGQCSCCKRGDA